MFKWFMMSSQLLTSPVANNAHMNTEVVLLRRLETQTEQYTKHPHNLWLLLVPNIAVKMISIAFKAHPDEAPINITNLVILHEQIKS